jgi:hypothetical protein
LEKRSLFRMGENGNGGSVRGGFRVGVCLAMTASIDESGLQPRLARRTR